MTSRAPDKYALYERSVQSPATHARWLRSVYQDLREGAEPRLLREDFCGTHALAQAWVRQSREHRALGLDLDPEPLDYGRRQSARRLDASQRRRLQIRLRDVRSVTRPGADLIAACNFSFCVFKTRGDLLSYFRCCRRSLRRDGLLVLEIAGGPGMIEQGRESKTIRLGREKYRYTWEQRSFDPITQEGRYAIHFTKPGFALREAFTYDWRMWNIPELRDALSEAGFAATQVYWEAEHRGKGTGEYLRTERGDNAYAWIAYVIGAV